MRSKTAVRVCDSLLSFRFIWQSLLQMKLQSTPGRNSQPRSVGLQARFQMKVVGKCFYCCRHQVTCFSRMGEIDALRIVNQAEGQIEILFAIVNIIILFRLRGAELSYEKIKLEVLVLCADIIEIVRHVLVTVVYTSIRKN